MKIRYFSLLMAISLISSAYASHINFKGLDFSMSRDEMVNVLQSTGYKCGKEKSIVDGSEEFACREGSNKKIQFEPADGKLNRLTFNCHTVNGCDLTFVGMAEAIREKYNISMKFSNRLDEWHYKNYCGKGTSGDKICVLDLDFTYWILLYPANKEKELDF